MSRENVTLAPDADARLAALLARAEAAEAQVAALRIANNGKLTVKQSAKGAVSVYGLQRWPVTLYREQWEPPRGRNAAGARVYQGQRRHVGDEGRQGSAGLGVVAGAGGLRPRP